MAGSQPPFHRQVRQSRRGHQESFSPDLEKISTDKVAELRANNIPAEIYLDKNVKLEKQLKYADQKNIPYVLIIGPEEAKKNIVMVKNMKTREQKELTVDELDKILNSNH